MSQVTSNGWQKCSGKGNKFMQKTHKRINFVNKILENRHCTGAQGQGPKWWNKYVDASFIIYIDAAYQRQGPGGKIILK